MIFNYIKTWFLLGLVGSLFVIVGSVFGGQAGAFIALTIAFLVNLFAYYNSESMALKAYNAQKLDENKYNHIYQMVQELADRANMPMPRLWIVHMGAANAFATGRNQDNASIAFTPEIIELLDQDELRGVIAHELSHIKNNDILIGSIAATFVAAITYIADMLRWQMWFGGSRREENNYGWILRLAAIVLMPLVAVLVQLAISRTREYMADESGSKISCSPLSLASALEKIHLNAKYNSLQYERATATQKAVSSMMICNPFKGAGSWIQGLFSTHPPLEKRVEKLRNMNI